MLMLIALTILLGLLGMACELAGNFRDQWVPQFEKRPFGQTSPLGVLASGAMCAVGGAFIAAVVFVIGDVFFDWGTAWATLVLVVANVYAAVEAARAIIAGRSYVHPDNPKGPFWPG